MTQQQPKQKEPGYRLSRPIAEVAQERALELDIQRKDPDKYKPIPTHLPDLNAIIGGFPANAPFYMLLKAMKKLGKSTVAMDFADAWRKGTNEPVIYFQCEELAVQYVDRVFSNRTSLTKDEIRMLKISDEAMQEVFEVAHEMLTNETNILLQDDLFTLDTIVAEMDRLKCTRAVIDNFQVLDAWGYKGSNMQERLAEQSRKLRELRNKKGKSFIVVSQESMSGKTFGSSGPDRDADIIIGIDNVYRLNEDDEEVIVPNLRKLIVEPSRIAREGECIVAFDGAKNRVSHLASRKVEDLTFEKIVEEEGLPTQQTIVFTD